LPKRQENPVAWQRNRVEWWGL